MARFIGTTKDYENYLGPRIKNKINNITQKVRVSRNKKCEFCSEIGVLESAHIHGKERKTIIRQVLSKYSNGNYYDIDLAKIEMEILELHKPIESVFYFLCRSCHIKYDNQKKSGLPINYHSSIKKDEGEKAIKTDDMQIKNETYVNIQEILNDELIIFNIVKAYLIDGISYRNIEKMFLEIDSQTRGGGFLVMSVLHELGITGEKKAVLKNKPIEEEIKISSGKYFNTLLKFNEQLQVSKIVME